MQELIAPGNDRQGRIWHRTVWTALLALVLLQFSISLPALAQTATVDAAIQQSCAGTRAMTNLNCTSRDFSSGLTFDQEAATAISNCVAGETVSVNVIASITSSSPTRYDGAYFIAENGIPPRLDNPASSCSIGVFPPSPAPYLNLDGDSCGDYTAGATSTLLMRNVHIQCNAVPGSNSVAIPYTLVFNNQTGGSSCTVGNVTANTPSKCISSDTAAITGITVNGYVRITKQTLPDGEPGSFAFAATANAGPGPAPPTFNLSDGQQQLVRVPFGAGGTGRTLTITEATLGGWDPTASITCTTPSGAPASYVTVNNATRTITATLTTSDFGAYCTITNTRQPTFRLQKTTVGGGYGPFNFTGTNLGAALPPITTTGGLPTPASPTVIPVVTRAAAITVTEQTNPDFFVTGFACTDLNAARTGNTGSFGSLSGYIGTVAAMRVVPGADFNCVFTNTLSAPAITVSKTSSVASVTAAGASITFTITVTNTGNVAIPNLSVSDPLGPANCGGSGTPTITNLAVGASRQCLVTYAATQTDFDGNGGGDGDIDNTANVTGTLGSHSISQSAQAAVTLVLNTALEIVKRANTPGPVLAGQIIRYTFEVRNGGNVTLSNVAVTDNTNATGTMGQPGGETMLLDAAPTLDSPDNAPNGIWGTLAPGDKVVFYVDYEVQQTDIDQLQ